MTYTCKFTPDVVYAFKNDILAAKFDYTTFCLSVISPKEFKQLERNPMKRTFNIRKIDLNNHKL
jgi:hypothetical protein